MDFKWQFDNNRAITSTIDVLMLKKIQKFIDKHAVSWNNDFVILDEELILEFETLE